MSKPCLEAYGDVQARQPGAQAFGIPLHALDYSETFRPICPAVRMPNSRTRSRGNCSDAAEQEKLRPIGTLGRGSSPRLSAPRNQTSSDPCFVRSRNSSKKPPRGEAGLG